ncbi:MAG: hypothetical protein HY360_16845 [Verrucomicrobia bacterium]|nr:hypothetical protein [Verrucomicrobiota bacterium]
MNYHIRIIFTACIQSAAIVVFFEFVPIGAIATESNPMLVMQKQDCILTPGMNQATNRQLIVSFIMTKPHHFGPAQGLQVDTCRAVWTSGICVIKIMSDYEHGPVFRPIGTRGYAEYDYSTKGELIVWRSAQKHIIFSKDKNDMIEKSNSYKVNSNGAVVSTNTVTQLYRYSIGSRDSIYMFDQLLLACGRGFSHHLSEWVANKSRELDTNMESLEFNGSHGKSLKGRWVMTCQRTLGFLVRECNFYVAGLEKPVLTVANSGVIECAELSLAKTGVFRYGDHEAQCEVLDFEQVDPSNAGAIALRNEVVNQVNADLPRGESEIIDFRGSKARRMSVE